MLPLSHARNSWLLKKWLHTIKQYKPNEEKIFQCPKLTSLQKNLPTVCTIVRYSKIKPSIIVEITNKIKEWIKPEPTELMPYLQMHYYDIQRLQARYWFRN